MSLDIDQVKAHRLRLYEHFSTIDPAMQLQVMAAKVSIESCFPQGTDLGFWLYALINVDHTLWVLETKADQDQVNKIIGQSE